MKNMNHSKIGGVVSRSPEAIFAPNCMKFLENVNYTKGMDPKYFGIFLALYPSCSSDVGLKLSTWR